MRKQVYTTFPTIFMFVLASCSKPEQTPRVVDTGMEKIKNIYLDTDSTIDLRENLVQYGDIQNIMGLSDTSFIVSDGINVLECSFQGNQIRKFGGVGKSRKEYIHAGDIYTTQKYVYVWCDATLRLKQYFHDGTFKNEYTGVTNAIHDFAVLNDSLVAYYLVGSGDKITCIKPLNKSKENEYWGQVSNEDIMLYFHPNSGGLAFIDNNLYFSPASRFELHEIDTETKKENVWKIPYSDFMCQHIDKNPRNESGDFDIKKTYDYIVSNSLTTGIYPANKSVCVIAETLKNGENNNQNDDYERYLNVSFVDIKNDHCRTYRTRISSEWVCYSFFNPYLYVVLCDQETGKYLFLKHTLPH